MLRVGLTGGLGSGKSTVGRLFAELGASVVSADEIGRSLMQPGLPVYAAIVQEFGAGVLQPDGAIDRKTLARIVFQQGRLQALNRIVHPAVVAAEEEWMRAVFAADPDAVAIVESALIFEAVAGGTAPGWIDRFDKLILVTAPDAVKIERSVSRMMAHAGEGAERDITLREGFEKDAAARLAAQIPDRDKAARCDYAIANDGSLAQTRQTVEKIYRELERESRGRTL